MKLGQPPSCPLSLLPVETTHHSHAHILSQFHVPEDPGGADVFSSHVGHGGVWNEGRDTTSGYVGSGEWGVLNRADLGKGMRKGKKGENCEGLTLSPMVIVLCPMSHVPGVACQRSEGVWERIRCPYFGCWGHGERKDGQVKHLPEV